MIAEDYTVNITNQDNTTIVRTTEAENLVYNIDESTVVVTEQSNIAIVESVGAIGPPGPTGPAGASVESIYAKQIDSVGDNLIYIGEAAIGSALSSSVWRIKKVEFIDDDISITWADGSDSFNYIWNNHLSYTYS